MQLEGTYTFNAPLEDVWNALMDPAVLALALPGGEALEQVGEDEYKAVMNMRVGPVQGRFEGAIELNDINPMRSYRMKVSGQGAPGFVSGEGGLELTPNDTAGVVLVYKGDVQIGGKIAGVSQRLVESTARSVIKQGLAALERQIVAGLGVAALEEDFAMPKKKQQTSAEEEAGGEETGNSEAEEIATTPENVEELVVDPQRKMPPSKLESADMVSEGAPIYPPDKPAQQEQSSREQYFGEQAIANPDGGAAPEMPWKPLTARTSDRPMEARATGARPSAVPQAGQASKGEFAGNVMRDVARDLASDFVPAQHQDKVLYAALGAIAAFLFVALVRLVQRD